jgi:hypothetical protein
VGARAYVLVAQQARIAGWGMEKYAGWANVAKALTIQYNDFRAARMPVGEYTERAAKIVADRLLLAKR